MAPFQMFLESVPLLSFLENDPSSLLSLAQSFLPALAPHLPEMLPDDSFQDIAFLMLLTLLAPLEVPIASLYFNF